MLAIEEAIRKYLIDVDSGNVSNEKRLAARKKVSQHIENRIYHARIPQASAMPCLVLRTLGVEPMYSLTGEGLGTETMVQMDTFVRRESKLALELGNWIRLAMSAYQGLMADVRVSSCIMARRSVFVNRPVDGNDDWTYQVSFDWRIFHYQE